MDKITFSVIVPVYNVENYLCQCVDSILSQEDCAFELILVDDGSTDRSGEICDQYAKKETRVHVIHKENGGSSDARNVGLSEATGDYILFVDGDDYIADSSFRNIGLSIKENHYPDLVFLECMKVYTDIGKYIPMHDGVQKEINTKHGDELKKSIAGLSKYPASPCTKAIARRLFRQNDLYFKKDLLCEDLEWALRVFLALQTAAYCNTPYYFYRQNRLGSNSSTKSPKMAWDVLGIMEEFAQLEETKQNSADRYMIRSIMEYLFRFLCMHSLQMQREERKDYVKRVKHCAYVLGTRKDRVSKVCAWAYRVFGVEQTGRLLCAYLWMRNKLHG